MVFCFVLRTKQMPRNNSALYWKVFTVYPLSLGSSENKNLDFFIQQTLLTCAFCKANNREKHSFSSFAVISHRNVQHYSTSIFHNPLWNANVFTIFGWFIVVAIFSSKGQLISKCPFGVIKSPCKSPKKSNEIFSRIFALAFNKRWNQKLYYTNYVK